MYHFIFPTQDTWISSGSSKIDGTSFKDQNFGKDQILEVKKEFYNSAFDYPTRALINFEGTDFTNMSQSIHNGKITNPKFYLRLYEAEGNAEMSEEYKLVTHPISQSWVEGTGKFGDRPKNTNGCSWENSSNPLGGTEVTWSQRLGEKNDGPIFISGSGNSASQSFSNQSPDIELNVTEIVDRWLDETNKNYGFLLKFSGSQETDESTFGHLKFFSRNTHTIFSPKLEVRWDDHTFESSSKWNAESTSGSLSELSMSGQVDNYLYMRGLRESYKENERVKFRVGARKRYIQKTFSNSVQTVTGSFITRGSGSYAIKDIATDEFIVPFSAYTTMSCDPTSNYFNQWLDGFYPDRVYKILLKLKYDDGQEQIFDDDFEFTVRRS